MDTSEEFVGKDGMKHTLRRDGDRPLAFTGELIAEASSHSHDGPNQNRWHEISIYKTDSGLWVLGIGYRTIWQGEADSDFAEHAESLEALVDTLRHFNPMAGVAGYPARDVYRERQERLVSDITASWGRLVADVLESAGPEFEEVI